MAPTCSGWASWEPLEIPHCLISLPKPNSSSPPPSVQRWLGHCASWFLSESLGLVPSPEVNCCFFIYLFIFSSLSPLSHNHFDRPSCGHISRSKRRVVYELKLPLLKATCPSTKTSHYKSSLHTTKFKGVQGLENEPFTEGQLPHGYFIP